MVADTIDKGIPIPSPGSKREGFIRRLRELTPGDSFAVAKDRRATLAVAVLRVRARSGQRFTTRLMDDGTVRVWRTA